MDAENRITKQIETGQHLLQASITNEEALTQLEADIHQWINANIALLNDIVNTNDTVDTNDFVQSYIDSSEQDVHEIDFQHRQYRPLGVRVSERLLDIEDHIIRLEAVAARLDYYPELSTLSTSSSNQINSRNQINHDVRAQQPLSSYRVFVAHGHDHDAKQAVARYIKKLGFEPIILEEQPNQGRTIIEKFEACANVDYVIVLLTPDDVGAVRSTETDALTFRARQNVIFELGYFYGKLGRHRVCALVKDRVEFPSDISGILWMRMGEENEWKFKLAQEMRAAGLPVDLNQLL